MAVTPATQAIFALQLQELIDRKAKISRVANRKYEEMFHGKATTEVTIRSPHNVELNVGVATDAGGTIAETDCSMDTESYLLSVMNSFNGLIKDVDQMINDFSLPDTLTDRIALRTSLNHDSCVGSLAVQNANTVLYDQSPATLTKDTVEALYADMQAAIREGDVEEDNQAIFLNPALLALTNQAPFRTGFDKSLQFKQVFNAGLIHGWNGSWSNNLPIKYTLTIGAVVTADDYISIRVPNAKKVSEGTSPSYDEVTFTAKAVPSAAGEFDVAGSASAQDAIIKAMINGTGTCGATNYIALSAADRNILRRAFVNCETFGDVTATKAGITARAGVTIVISMTSGSNVIAARTNLIIGCDPKAIHFAETMKNFKIVGTDANNTKFGSNVMWENVYGGKVTTTNKARIVVAEITN